MPQTYMYHPTITKILNNIDKVIIGKREASVLSLTALLAEGHVLLEDVPGVGKTMLVKTLARSIDSEFKRIQFTPDLLPSDVTGVSIYNPKTLAFEFRPGPILGNVVLADEINRTSPKTQAALLEAMEESNITVEGNTLPLRHPFFVMATQNPVDYEGTYPLPEAQLDRFLLKINMGYPTPAEEVEMLQSKMKKQPLEGLQPVLSQEELLEMIQEVNNVYLDTSMQQYIVAIANKTRKHHAVYLGLSPRGSIALMRAAKAYAYINDRDYVIPDDVQYLAPFVIAHRLILQSEARFEGITPDKLVAELLDGVPVPVRKEYMNEK